MPETFKLIQTNKFGNHQSELEFVSEEGRDFINKLLTYDPSKRFSAAQALEHPWIRLGRLRRLEDQFLAHALINLQFFNVNLRFKQTFGEYIFKSMTSFAQFDATTKHLKSLDIENTGKLTRTQLLEALRSLNGIDYSEDQLDKLIA